MPKNNLSIYLIKETITDFNDIVEENKEELQKYDDDSIAYFTRTNTQEPTWLKSFFKLNVDCIKTANARAVLLKRIHIDEKITRIFAITFGYGKNLLKEDVYEEQFGLKIVLNTIEFNKIRKISKTEIGKNYKQSQEQMPRESAIGEFGFDADRDLIKYVTGKCDEVDFGKSIITGGDLFNLVIEKNIDDIEDFLKKCYKKYNLINYKENFDWLDNIKLVKGKETIEQLNSLVVERLNNRNFNDIWLAVPDVISWEKVKCVYIPGQINRSAEYTDLDNDVFVNSFKNSKIVSFDQLKSKYIMVKSAEDDSTIIRWSAAKCLVGSIEKDGQAYAINNGNWYRIDNDFVKETSDIYNSIPLFNKSFIDCPNDKDEDYYNQLFVESYSNAHLIHKYKIPIGGGSGNNLEPCDIAIGKNLIHIKRNGGSSLLSHLFNQAVNSCTALQDEKFRDKFREKLLQDGITDVLTDEFNSNDYTIVLGIINQYKNERPHIPFFSKLSIKYAFRDITNMGYKFELKNIKKKS